MGIAMKLHKLLLLLLPLLVVRAFPVWEESPHKSTAVNTEEFTISKQIQQKRRQTQNNELEADNYDGSVQDPEIHYSTYFQAKNMIAYDSQESLEFDVFLASYLQIAEKLSRLEIMVKNYKGNKLNNILYQEQLYNLTDPIIKINNNNNKNNFLSWLTPSSVDDKPQLQYDENNDEMILIKPVKITNKLFDYKKDQLNNVRYLEPSAMSFEVSAKFSPQLDWFIIDVRHKNKNVVLTNDMKIDIVVDDDTLDDSSRNSPLQLVGDDTTTTSNSKSPSAMDAFLEKYEWLLIYLLTSVIFVVLLFFMACLMRCYLRREATQRKKAVAFDLDLEKERLIRMFFNQCTS